MRDKGPADRLPSIRRLNHENPTKSPLRPTATAHGRSRGRMPTVLPLSAIGTAISGISVAVPRRGEPTHSVLREVLGMGGERIATPAIQMAS